MAKLLIIDDDVDICKALKKFLESQGHEITVAHDGQAGLAAAHSKPDLIICDISMPVMNGQDVVKTLRQDRRLEETPFIFLSAHSDRDSVRNSMNLGGDDFIPKPAQPDEILAAVNYRLQRRQRQQQRRNEIVQKAMQIFAGIVDDLGDSRAAVHWLAEAASSDATVRSPLQRAATPPAAEETGPNNHDTFLATKDNRKFFVKLSEIKALLADGEYSVAHWGQDQHMMFRKPLKQWEEELADKGFLRVHRKAMINLKYLECVSQSPEGAPRVHLKDFKPTIEVSQRKIPALNRTLKELTNR